MNFHTLSSFGNLPIRIAATLAGIATALAPLGPVADLFNNLSQSAYHTGTRQMAHTHLKWRLDPATAESRSVTVAGRARDGVCATQQDRAVKLYINGAYSVGKFTAVDVATGRSVPIDVVAEGQSLFNGEANNTYFPIDGDYEHVIVRPTGGAAPAQFCLTDSFFYG